MSTVTSENLSAQGGHKSREQTTAHYSLTEAHPSRISVERTRIFSRALSSITKAGHKIQTIARKSLDEMGDLAEWLCCLSLNSQTSGTFDNPGEGTEQPPEYWQTVAETPETIISDAILTAHMRCLTLEEGGCLSLVEDELESVLNRLPDYQGEENNSALLYHTLRRIYRARKKYEEAILITQKELASLPLAFITNHDPQAFVDYAELLEEVGRSDEANQFLDGQNFKDSPYIERRKELWRAKFNRKNGNLAEAERAYLRALIIAHKDPQVYLDFIRFYSETGQPLLAQALTSAMHRVVLESSQWQEYGDTLKDYIEGELPEDLKGYYGTMDDLIPAIRLWINSGLLEESSPYWLPLMKYISDLGADITDEFCSRNRALKPLILDIPRDLSMSSEGRLQYYETLYKLHRSWIDSDFYKDAVLGSMFYALKEEFDDGEAQVKLAQFAFDQGQVEGLLKSHLVNIKTLEILIDDHISKGDINSAIEILALLIQQSRWNNSSSAFQKWMDKLARHMSKKQSALILESLFGNFSWVYSSIPKTITSLADALGQEVIANLIRQVLNAGSVKFHEENHSNLVWLLQENIYSPILPKFQEPIHSALLSHPTIKRVWDDLLRESEYIAEVKRLRHWIRVFRETSAPFKSPVKIKLENLPTENPPRLKPSRRARLSSSSEARKLAKLLSSIGIQQRHVPGDGLCMWHALAANLNHLNIGQYNTLQLQQIISSYTAASSYAPAQWGTSDHLMVVSQYFNVPVIEILSPNPGELAAIWYHPSLEGGTIIQQLTSDVDILTTLQHLHSQYTPPIIMINNMSLSNSGLVLDGSNHWSAGIWQDGDSQMIVTQHSMNHEYNLVFLSILGAYRTFAFEHKFQ
ncbi:MAG: hypothetical protein ACR2PX_20285 [Endozoicomonas sp.]|uniref:hypothetical protein n=1 Tax=Endozoicomonas sp. TaxID=1892382 RepID=UPI003D9B671E